MFPQKCCILVTGIVYPGSLCCIMGASGSGKTTLMDALAYRAPESVSITGQILVNGIQTGKFMSSISGYVHQTDMFYTTVTVSEHLHFMAKMKMDRRLRQWERDRRVDELVQELSLTKCEHSRIGTLSGGERKRLAFACEILTDPPLLFLDEATTGLDSHSAQKIVSMLRRMSGTGKTILCTIHQPSSQIFAMFDKVCLLAEGRMAYMGPAESASTFLKDLNYVCPELYNPADFYIRTLAVQPGQEEACRARIKSICEGFAVSGTGKDLEDQVDREMAHCRDLTESQLTKASLMDIYFLAKHHVQRPLWITRTARLTGRAFLESYRNPRVHRIRMMQRIFIGLFIGLCFLGLGGNGIQNTQAILFLFTNENSFVAITAVMTVFPTEFPIFLREHKSGLYDVNSYYISKILSSIPGFTIDPFVYTTIVYWITGLRATASAFFLSSFIIVLTINAATACGCFFAATFNNISAALTAIVPFNYILLTSGGFYMNLRTIPFYIAWARYMSWFFYCNEGLSIIQWENVTLSCGPNTSPENGTCITRGEQVLDLYGYSAENWALDILALPVIYIVFHCLAYNSVLMRSRKS